MWISVGLLAMAGAYAYAQYERVEIRTIEGLESRLFFLSVLTYVVYGALVVTIADVVRRTAAVFSARDALRVFLCAFVVMVAFALPQYVYARIVFARIASLETPSRLQTMLRFYGQHRFWRCLERPDYETIEANAAVIDDDLRRYGLRRTRTVVSYPGCPYTMLMQPLDPASPARSFGGIDWFEGRLLEIDAAQRYVRGDDGPLTRPLVPNDLVGALTVAALSSGLAVSWLSTTLFRSRVLSTSHRFRRRWTWRPRTGSRLDAWLAANWPTVWLSRVHVALPLLLLPPAVVSAPTLLNASPPISTLTPWVVLSLVLGFRSQGVIRGLPKSAVREIGAFSMHTAAYLLALVLPMVIFALRWEISGFTLLGCVILAAMWQGARNGSIVTTYGGHCVAVAIVGGAILAVQSEEYAPTQVTAFIVLIVICEVVLIWLARRVAATPRRLLVSAVLAMAPAPGSSLIVALADGPRDLNAAIIAFAGAIAFAGVAICLLALHHDRRVVA